ncbi:MAG: acyl carrier protein [Paludibacteraceae bacterium]|nr:acyl carrier protein [Paludibacteraceae bacterium]
MEIEAKVKEMIAEKLSVELSQVTDSASFTNDLGADSLDTVELLMDFEKEFNVKIAEEDAEKIATVGDAIDFIKNHQA